MSETTTQSNAPKRITTLPLKASNILKGMMAKYLLKAQFLPKLPWKKSAWASAGFPVELLWGYDIFALHPENAACVSGVRRVSQEFIEMAESAGYSRDLCSYMKTNIGALQKGVNSTLGGVAKPSFCASTNTICDTHVKWFQIQARNMKVPYFGFDVPSFVSGSDDSRMDDYVDYLVDQFYDYFDFVKKTTGRYFDEKKFLTVLEKSDKLAELWHEIYEYRKLSPCPYVFQDTLAAIFPMVILPGLDEGIKFYQAILAELKERAKEGIGSMPPGTEKYRILFEGIPMWYKIRWLFELSNYGATVVYEPYTFSFGPRKPLGLSFDKEMRELAKIMVHFPYNYNLETRIKYFEQLVDDYKLDGVILHSNMSCRPSCAGMIDLKNAIQQDKGIPVWLMEGDMNDPRSYAEGPMKNRMESFIELLAANKK
jgi:benzoyl-CoA reductase/2-hydroxyglutaryl-CoA dehydratase subunit BcrC/BadD/HgdB